MILQSHLPFLARFFSFSIVLLQLQFCSALSPDGLTLMAFKAAVSDDPSSALAGWDESDGDPCLWPGVSCANISGFSYPRVVALSVPGKRLSGYIPSELGSLAYLRRLNLHSNFLSGAVPSQLSNASSLHSLYLYSNNLSGPFPSSVCNLPRLQNLDLSGNHLSGWIPSDLGSCRQLQRLLLSNNGFSGVVPSGIWPGLGSLVLLDLSSNDLTGPIPPDLGDLKSLSGTLNLSHNRFSGEIPSDLGNLPATVRLDLRANELSGEIPRAGALSNQGATTFLGNAKLCGSPLPNPCQALSPAPAPARGQVLAPRSGATGSGEVPKKGLKPEVIILIAVANAAGVAAVGLVVVYAYWKVKDGGGQGCSCTRKTKLGGGAGGGTGKGMPCFFCWNGKEARISSPGSSLSSSSSSSEEEGGGGSVDSVGGEGRLVALDKGFRFELDELLRASAYVLGKSRSGIVYKVVLGSGVPVAVRRLGEGSAQRRGEFAAEAQAIGRVRHPNVVRLRAYFWSPDEKLLVCDFVPNGSLAAALHGRSSQPGLSWPVRLKIAKGTARGLAHIHECSPRKFVHGDVKPSNILLDADFNPRISDFGLSRLLHIAGGTSDSGSAGSGFFLGGALPYGHPASAAQDRPNSYSAPEARAPGGRPTQKWDVYSFGLVVLELLTGKPPEFSPSPAVAAASSSRPPPPSPDGAELVRWVRKGLEEERVLAEMLDPALLWQARAKSEVAAAFRVALACTEPDPELRPRMKAVSEGLEKIGT